MKRVRFASAFVSLSLAALMIAGCGGGDSTPSSMDIRGVAIDGYLKNISVCVDRNDDGVCNEAEARTLSGSGGFYYISGMSYDSNKALIAEVLPGITVDEDNLDRYVLDADYSGEPIRFMSAYGKQNIITPITTLVYSQMRDGNLTLDEAEKSVAELLGISINDLYIDYIAKGDERLRAKALNIATLLLKGYNPKAVVNSLKGADVAFKDIDFVSKYPTIAKYLRMSNGDFITYISVGDACSQSDWQSFASNSIGDITLGAPIKMSCSKYLNKPIFSLSGLQGYDGGYILNADGGVAKTDYFNTVCSNSYATRKSNKLGGGYSESIGINTGELGIGAGIKASFAHSKITTSSNDGISVYMEQTTSGKYAKIFTDNVDLDHFSSNLLGSTLDEEQTKKYFDYNSTSKFFTINGKDYNDTNVTFGVWFDGNPYGLVQILAMMESAFWDMRDSGTISNAEILRLHILATMANFYRNYGDGFITKVGYCNYAYGRGELDISGGASDTTFGASAGASMSVSVDGVSASKSFGGSYGHDSGWASRIANATVSATAVPAEVTDAVAWGSAINAELRSYSGGSLSIPEATLANISMPDVPSIPAKKQPISPLDVNIKSFPDWMKDKNSSVSQDTDDQINNEDNASIGDGGVEEAGKYATLALYPSYKKELEELRRFIKENYAKSYDILGSADNNLIRPANAKTCSIDEVVKYAKVLEVLRPDLNLPNDDDDKNSYKNIVKLLGDVHTLGKLSTYLSFLTQIEEYSGVTKDGISGEFDRFYELFTDAATSKIADHLSRGVDVESDMLKSFYDNFLGHPNGDSENIGCDVSKKYILYGCLEESDSKYDYVKNALLEPNKSIQNSSYKRVWMSAPGGYVPYYINTNNEINLFRLEGFINDAYEYWINLSEHDRQHTSYFSEKMVMPNYTPMLDSTSSDIEIETSDDLHNLARHYDIIDNNTLPINTPLYPVVVYKEGGHYPLIFVQFNGSYPIFYTADGIAHPNIKYGHINMKFDSFDINSSAYGSVPSNNFRSLLKNTNTDLSEKLSWKYTFRLKDGTELSNAQKRIFNTLTIVDWGHITKEPNWIYYPSPSDMAGCKNHCEDDYVIDQSIFLKTKAPTGATLSLAEGSGSESVANKTVLILLPVNKSTDSNFAKNYFNYTVPDAFSDLVKGGDFGIYGNYALPMSE